jgi:hypothetical protein
MELWVFSDNQLSTIAEWQAAIDAEAYPLKLDDTASFEGLRGFLPTYLRGALTGFECCHDEAGELISKN